MNDVTKIKKVFESCIIVSLFYILFHKNSYPRVTTGCAILVLYRAL